MVRRSRSRHARPTGRRALQAAYSLLESDVSHLRASSFADHLELIRLSALVEGLVVHLHGLTAELSELRRDLQLARSVPDVRAPEVELLTLEVAELRATVASQQSSLSALTGQLIDVMGRLEHGIVRAEPVPAGPVTVLPEVVGVAPAPVAGASVSATAGAVATPAPVTPGPVTPTPVTPAPLAPHAPTSPAHTAAPLALATPLAPSAPVDSGSGGSAPGGSARDVPVLVGASALAVGSPGIVRESHVDITSPAVAPPAHEVLAPPAPLGQTAYPAAADRATASSRTGSSWRPFTRSTTQSEADAPLDDETVLRLRLIRESFGR